jgi:hypothetical protein
MSLDDFLYQTCTISRPTASGAGRYNQTALENIVVATGVACRLVEKDIRMIDQRSGEYAWVQVTLLILPADADVEQDDEISIDDVDGVYVAKKRLQRKAMNAAHHMSVVVEALNG